MSYETSWQVAAFRFLENPWVRSAGVLAALFMAVELFAVAERVGQDFQIVPPWDKAVHFCYYGTMALLLANGVGRRWLWLPLVLVPVIGALDEWHQMGIPGRDASFLDWLADELGTLAFVAAYWWGFARVAARRQVSERAGE